MLLQTESLFTCYYYFVQTFEELASLAEKGSLDNMDITGRILKTKSADVYASLSSEFTAFALGQAVGKDIGKVVGFC